MANPEHLSKLKEGVEAWNQWREENPDVVPDLSKAGLRKGDLKGADLRMADLSKADLKGANLIVADLSDTDLNNADLTGADLSESDLSGADLSSTNFSKADLSGAYFLETEFYETILEDAKIANASMYAAGLSALNLSLTKGLDKVRHEGPSSIGIDTIKLSEGKIPNEFLKGCGLSPWEIEIVSLYNTDLKPSEVDAILGTRIYQKRVDGPLYIGGVFISYSHSDSACVGRFYEELQDAGVSVWLDKHDILAGNIEKQVMKQIRINDIVLLVLSKNSIESDWVETELEEAREKEKGEGRNVLCPVAIDDSWKAKDGVLWRKLKRDNVILDFSAWETEEEFNVQFDKLIKGMQINY